MSKEKTIVVKFLKNSTPYIKGDIAGISSEEFEKLEKTGAVSILKAEKPETVKVTKEILKQYPELADQGVKNGDKITVEEFEKLENKE